MNFKTFLKFLAVILVLGILFVASYVLREKHNASTRSSLNDPSTDVSGLIPTESTTPISSRYEYEEEAPGTSDWVSGEGKNDGRIFEINLLTNTRTLIVPSVKALSKAVTNDCGCKFVKIADSKFYPYLYFSVAYIEGYGGIYRYDRMAKSITELKSSKYFEVFSGKVSEFSPHIATIQNPNNYEQDDTLYLINLDRDEVKTLTKLPEGQTFNFCKIEGCLGSLGAEINWLNANEFEINIYDEKNFTINPEYGNQKAKLIETRKFKIN